jgi:hypothetical protein
VFEGAVFGVVPAIAAKGVSWIDFSMQRIHDEKAGNLSRSATLH